MRILLILLLLIALPAQAAELSLVPAAASAGTTFSIPVTAVLGSEKVNAVEGTISIPDGLTIDSISTAGALSLWVQEPHFVGVDHAVEFTGGSPSSITGSVLLFTLHAHAASPGAYTLTPTEFFAYRADGKGTRVTISTQPVAIDVATAGTKVVSAPGQAPTESTPLVAQVGKDASLFNGKYFVALAGGDDGSGVNYYEVQEGWWRRAKQAGRYYVLQDQQRGSTLYIVAVNNDGGQATVVLPAASPWGEWLTCFGIALVLGLLIGYFIRRKRS